jgi:membrane-bound ClpP family serine protease
LILHTPGGDAAATESLVGYLRAMFDTNIRAIVPQLAMSAGTMLARACQEILMGKHSSLGPIDPQIGGLAAHGVIEEFTNAQKEVASNHALGILWQPIIAKYTPTLIGECQKAIKWAETMVTKWLVTGMFKNAAEPADAAKKVLTELGSHALTLSHVHRACVQTLTETPALKIIENQMGVAFIPSLQPIPFSR